MKSLSEWLLDELARCDVAVCVSPSGQTLQLPIYSNDPPIDLSNWRNSRVIGYIWRGDQAREVRRH